MKMDLYKQSGEKSGSTDLPVDLFEQTNVAPEVIHQVVNSVMAESRNTVAHAKTRSDVRGGGRKPWRQKGTGRARAGSIRSPLWKGGGVTFGPSSERNFKKRVTKKTKRLGFTAVLSQFAKEKKVLVLEDIKLPEAKTAEFVKFFDGLTKKFDQVGKKVLIITGENKDLFRAARNATEAAVQRGVNVSIMDLLRSDSLIITKSGLEELKKR